MCTCQNKDLESIQTCVHVKMLNDLECIQACVHVKIRI